MKPLLDDDEPSAARALIPVVCRRALKRITVKTMA